MFKLFKINKITYLIQSTFSLVYLGTNSKGLFAIYVG